MSDRRPTDLSELPLALTVPEAAAVLGRGVSGMYADVRAGRVYSFRLGRKVLVPRRAIEALLAGEEQPGQAVHSEPAGGGLHGRAAPLLLDVGQRVRR